MNIDNFEHLIRRGANKLGLDVTRYRPAASETGRLSAMLAHHKVNLVFDIGANTGQFASSLRRSGYVGKIVSFEPLSSAHAELLRSSQRDELWEVAPRVAIGDHEGEVDIHIAGNSVSSSILGMLDSHVDAAPTSHYVGNESVPMATMDTQASRYCDADTRSFMKIDTQGYEPQVLDGAQETLGKVMGVQLELSLVPLYEHQKLFDDLVDRVRSLGFSIWALWPALFDPDSGRMVQADATFFRK